MAENHVNAEKDYVEGMKYKDIAEKYGVSLNTVKSWKTRHGWVRNKGAPQEKGVHTKKRGAPKGNKNAVGNEGGAPARNKNAVTHGFFSKYIPQESLDIIEVIQERSPVDMLWDQIKIQYAAIIRAQKIMYVIDKDDMAKEKSQEGWGESGADKYDIQFAWDRQATFLNAQSRAMSELRGLIKQFDEMSHVDDERRLKLEGMRLGIEKTKAEVEKISTGSDDKPIEILIKRKSKGGGQ